MASHKHGTYDDCTYDKDSAVKFWTAFRVSDTGALANPNTLVCQVLSPDGLVTAYTAGVDPELDSPAVADAPTAIAEELEISDAENATPWTGIATLEIVLDQEGDYQIQWKATGNVTVTREQRAYVRSSVF